MPVMMKVWQRCDVFEHTLNGCVIYRFQLKTRLLPYVHVENMSGPPFSSAPLSLPSLRVCVWYLLYSYVCLELRRPTRLNNLLVLATLPFNSQVLPGQQAPQVQRSPAPRESARVPHGLWGQCDHLAKAGRVSGPRPQARCHTLLVHTVTRWQR